MSIFSDFWTVYIVIVASRVGRREKQYFPTANGPTPQWQFTVKNRYEYHNS